MDRFDEVAEAVDMDTETFEKCAVTRERKDRTSYPEKLFMHLVGFKTWTPDSLIEITPYSSHADYSSPRELYSALEEQQRQLRKNVTNGGLGLYCNIERFGLAYGTSTEEFLQFFAQISTATEPFVIWHSPREHNPETLYNLDREGKETGKTWRVRAENGEAKVHEITYERKSEEELGSVSLNG